MMSRLAAKKAFAIPSKARGFTLMESIFALAIAGITLTIGVPSFTQTLETNRLSSQSNALVSALRLARSEAVRRGIPVSVCRTNELGNACANDGGGWENGWLVVADDGSTISEMPALQGKRTLVGSSGLTTSVAFSPLGEPSASGQFMLCELRNQGDAREIELNAIGRISVAQHKAATEYCAAG